MSYHVRLFHLTLHVPNDSRRARSLCGFSLREGARFDLLEHYVLECDIKRMAIRPYHINAFIRLRHRNAFQAFKREDYWAHVCPECLEHPEYALTLLADLP